MNTSGPDRNEEALNRLLRRWEVNAPLPLGFRSEVWRRIERSQRPRGLQSIPWFFNFVGSSLIKPSAALVYLTILLIGGSIFGWSQARREAGQTNEMLGQRYVRLIDPYQRLR